MTKSEQNKKPNYVKTILFMVHVHMVIIVLLLTEKKNLDEQLLLLMDIKPKYAKVLQMKLIVFLVQDAITFTELVKKGFASMNL